jgi:hypothetical protein
MHVGFHCLQQVNQEGSPLNYHVIGRNAGDIYHTQSRLPSDLRFCITLASKPLMRTYMYAKVHRLVTQNSCWSCTSSKFYVGVVSRQF